jgi:ribonuclease D
LFKVFNEPTLLEIARQTPLTLEALAELPGMSPAQMRRHGTRLLQVVQRGLRAVPLHPPRRPRPDERYLQRLEALRQWRKAAGEKMSVPSDVALPRDLLLALAQTAPHTLEELASAMHEYPWRLERFGAQILKALNPKQDRKKSQE